MEKYVFVSMTNAGNGAEKVMALAAAPAGALLVFLKSQKHSALVLPTSQRTASMSRYSWILGFFRFCRMLRVLNPDVVMSTHPVINAGLGILRRCGIIRARIIARECTSVFVRFSGLKLWIYRLFYYCGYPSIDLVVCQTENMRNELLKGTAFITLRKIIVKENPIDLQASLHLASQPLPVEWMDRAYIVAAGRLIPEKGFDLLIRAFAKIRHRHPDSWLLILGDGPQDDILRTLVKELNLCDRVCLHPRVENPFPYFKQARLGVVSSRREGFPNVLLEMMACNARVISTRCAGGIEQIPGITSLPADNIPALAEAIDAMLNDQHELISADTSFLKYRTAERYMPDLLEALQTS